MRTIIILIMLLTMSATSFSQPVTTTDYLQKSKKQKTTAWVILGGGASFTLLGFHLKQYAGIGVVMAGIGVLSVLGSVPLFIASSKNRLRGINLSFKNEPVTLFQKSSFAYRSVPSLSLKISL